MTDWTPWPGGECPVDVVMYPEVEVRFRSGRTASGESARLCWRHYGTEQDIVAYRVLPSRADLAEIERLRAEVGSLRTQVDDAIHTANLDEMRSDRLRAELAQAREAEALLREAFYAIGYELLSDTFGMEWAMKTRAAITKEQQP